MAESLEPLIPSFGLQLRGVSKDGREKIHKLSGWSAQLDDQHQDRSRPAKSPF